MARGPAGTARWWKQRSTCCSWRAAGTPAFISKLRLEEDATARSRDLANLTQFASKQFERPLNWQVLGLQREWLDWMDSAVLFIASNQAPELSERDKNKLRDYALAGGLLFTHANGGSEKFTAFAQDLAKELFPGRSLENLSEDHPLYSSVFTLSTKAPLMGVSNGARLLLVHSPTDLAKGWQSGNERTYRPAFELGTNVVMYATGKRDLRNRVTSLVIPQPVGEPVGRIPLVRLRYDGNWDPEPVAWNRMAAAFESETSIRLNVQAVELQQLRYALAPVAHLTGTAGRQFTDLELKAIGQYVESGGLLFIDACGSSPAFIESINTQLLAKGFPDSKPTPLPADHILLTGKGEAMADLTQPRLRTYGREKLGDQPVNLRILSAGKGHIIISDLDITCGLLGTYTWGIVGYEPTYARDVVKNLVLWAISAKTEPRP